MKNKIIKWLILLTLLIGLSWKIWSLPSETNIDMPNYTELPKENICLGLNYHRIHSPSLWNKTVEFLTGTKELTTYNVYADEFAKQMRWLKKQQVFLATQNDLYEFRQGREIPNNCVWISFDDGDESIYNNAFPVLKQYDIPFTMYLITGHVGEAFQNFNLATWDQLRSMQKSGLVDFGSHTHDMHYTKNGKAVFLNEGYAESFRIDLQRSKQTMEQELGVNISTIAYPFGETNKTVTEIVQQEGFKQAFILSPNPISQRNTLFYTNRYLLDQNVFNQFVKPYIQQQNEKR
ncbi:polysaccharide deacetylase family protein [Bacillus manliponensis]|uniref:polysaccharide deacetylase family protein n=1 Tax=Bacillus manliponensis TaxID=574376 RepID=UPI0006922FC4|nr:polysaccharide deacetylase family protein [Bacillus manliponensis]